MSTSYCSVADAAKMLKKRPETIRRWIREGKIRARHSGMELRLRVDEVRRIALEESRDFDRLALASLTDLWDNEEDAIYDNWRELYDAKGKKR